MTSRRLWENRAVPSLLPLIFQILYLKSVSKQISEIRCDCTLDENISFGTRRRAWRPCSGSFERRVWPLLDVFIHSTRLN